MNELKYSKEFIMLCTDWINGKETDKSKFSHYIDILEENSIERTSFRLWGFEQESIYKLLKEQQLKIDSEIIESSFVLEGDNFIDYSYIEILTKKLYGYSDDYRFIVKNNGKIFNIYEPLLEVINNKKLLKNITYTEKVYIEQTYLQFSHQNEVLRLFPDDIIHLENIELLLLAEYMEEMYKGVGEYSYKKGLETCQIKDHFCFTKEDFIKYLEINKGATQELFFSDLIDVFNHKNKEFLINSINNIIQDLKNNKKGIAKDDFFNQMFHPSLTFQASDLKNVDLF